MTPTIFRSILDNFAKSCIFGFLLGIISKWPFPSGYHIFLDILRIIARRNFFFGPCVLRNCNFKKKSTIYFSVFGATSFLFLYVIEHGNSLGCTEQIFDFSFLSKDTSLSSCEKCIIFGVLSFFALFGLFIRVLSDTHRLPKKSALVNLLNGSMKR